MATDNVIANPGAGGANFRMLHDGTVVWPAGVTAYATSLTSGANVLQVVTPAFGLPVKPDATAVFPVQNASGTTNWGQSLAVVAGATATVINIPATVAGYQIKGMLCHGNGDGYFFIQVGGVTKVSGRTRSTAPMLQLILPNGIAVPTGSALSVLVTNESGSTADYEVTLLGA